MCAVTVHFCELELEYLRSTYGVRLSIDQLIIFTDEIINIEFGLLAIGTLLVPLEKPNWVPLVLPGFRVVSPVTEEPVHLSNPPNR